jgi:hypothetical protein
MTGRAELQTLIGTSPFHAYLGEDPRLFAQAIALAAYGPVKIRIRPPCDFGAVSPRENGAAILRLTAERMSRRLAKTGYRGEAGSGRD